MFQLVDFWRGGYNEREKYGVLNLNTFELNYFTRDKIQILLKNNTILGLKTVYSFELDLNDTENKYITRVIKSDYNKITNTYYAKMAYGGVLLVLNRPIKLKRLINGVNFEYKGIMFNYRHTTQYGKCVVIKQPNWKKETLDIIKEIIEMFDYAVEIEYPFRVNFKNNTLYLQYLLDIIGIKRFSLKAIHNYDSNYKAIEYINVGNLDFSRLISFSFLFDKSFNLKYVDFSECEKDLDLFNDCIIKNPLVNNSMDKIQDALNNIIYGLTHNDLSTPIVFILNERLKVFAEFLSSDNRVTYLGNLSKDINIKNNIDILISKYLLIRKNTTKQKFFYVFVK